jgi:WD40 repeat protein
MKRILQVFIWNVEDDSSHILDGHNKSVNCVQWSSNGSNLVSGSWDGTIHWWEEEE